MTKRIAARPLPPDELHEEECWMDEVPLRFAPAPEVEEWARRIFIAGNGPLVNGDHDHLSAATIGFLWTNAGAAKGGQRIVGQCEMPKFFSASPWTKAGRLFQLEQWFGAVPDFLITIFAPYAARCDDLRFCALVEHELYHAGIKLCDGEPQFDKQTGAPKLTMRGHDVEEFVGIVKRYGPGAGAGATARLVEAAQRAPLIGAAEIAGACACGARL